MILVHRPAESVARWVRFYGPPVTRNGQLARRCWQRGVLAVLRRLRAWSAPPVRPAPVRRPRQRPATVPVLVRAGPARRPETPHAP